MKKLVNNPNDVVEEMIEGFVKAHNLEVEQLESNDRSIISKKRRKNNKVAILTGGGSGHEPAFMGYIGEGMADGVAVGNVFASPPPAPILETTKAIDNGSGVLYIYGNYAGDLMNFGMAAELAEMEDIKTKSVIVTDDIASAPKAEKNKRRGIAGEFFVYKIAGAAADYGLSLDEVTDIASKANNNTISMGVGLSPCALPQTGEPSFEIADDEMEIGLGHHGEPGIRKEKLKTANEVTEDLMQAILEEAELKEEDKVAVLVNGLGSTPLMELYIVFNKVEEILNKQKVSIHKSFVGNYITSLEMGGMSISIIKLDSQMEEMINHPVNCPMFVQK